jgi:hypothetical protein
MKEVDVVDKCKSNGITLLAINTFRFRGDLEALAKSGFTIYTLPYKWQTRIFYAYKESDRKSKLFLTPSVGSSLYVDRIRVRKYLSRLMLLLIRKKKIDCVIGSGIFYNQDFDWGSSSESAGCPYIILHKENLIGSKDRYLTVVKQAKHLHEFGFVGTSIVFHNKKMKEIFVKYGGVSSDSMFSLGALRMDMFVKDVQNKNKNKNKNNRITLFSFPPSDVISKDNYSNDFGWHKLHDSVHMSFVDLAVNHPEIEFVIKHKGVDWDVTKKILKDINAFGLKNLKIYGTEYNNVHKLILESDVITGFSTTALLEAGIAEKPIVFPFFHEASDSLYKDFTYFKDSAHNMFDVANSKEEYKDLIMKKFKNPVVSYLNKKYRKIEFENQVSSLKADSLEQYTCLIKGVVNKRKLRYL